MRDTAIRASNTCKVSDKELAGLQDKIHNIDVRVTSLGTAKKSQDSTIRDIRKQVKKISQTNATRTLPADSAGHSSDPTNPPPNTATITPALMPGQCIPVIVSSRASQQVRRPHNPGQDRSQQPRHGPSRDPATRHVLDAQTAVTGDFSPQPDYGTSWDPATGPLTGASPTSDKQTDRGATRDPATLRQSPAEHLAARRVFNSSHHLIIGDSVLRYMQGRKMACRRGERVQVISVSGMTVEDLTHWLIMQPKAPHIRMVTFHVGVNDCKRREVTSYMWHDLVSRCHRAFPNAHIQASSILPVKRPKCALGETVTMSNANLTAVCKKREATLIDNSDSFAPHGRPLLELYNHKNRHDLVHPSHSGLIQLARNIRKSTTSSALSSSEICENPLNDSQCISAMVDERLHELRTTSAQKTYESNLREARGTMHNTWSGGSYRNHRHQMYPSYQVYHSADGEFKYFRPYQFLSEQPNAQYRSPYY